MNGSKPKEVGRWRRERRKGKMDNTHELTKEEFLQQYVLNRSLVVDNLSGEATAKEAIKAWTIIATEVENDTRTP
jgi:hypothetical protein